ncbi:hypothetical protein HG530_014551 [Fusarium avenaceum]|nr:hypothetical protein HG530_014551 [Fusarium avenaceum]
MAQNYTSTRGTDLALQALHAGTAGWQYECFVTGVWTNILDYYFQLNQNTGYMLAHEWYYSEGAATGKADICLFKVVQTTNGVFPVPFLIVECKASTVHFNQGLDKAHKQLENGLESLSLANKAIALNQLPRVVGIVGVGTQFDIKEVIKHQIEYVEATEDLIQNASKLHDFLVKLRTDIDTTFS